MKYLLIDGNNLAIRCAFANQELTNNDGVPTAIHYGVLNSLIALKEQYPDYQFLMVWDGKSSRRQIEAQVGVEKQLIKSGYKENRDKENRPQPFLDFYSQVPYLKKGLMQVGIPQIRINDFEADDVIASYCNFLKDHDIIVVTSDKDFLQLLNSRVEIWDGMKQKLITENTFKEKYGIKPPQHIDCGALMGDASDNIFGVPGWGEKTALKAIQEYGDWKGVLDHLKNEFSSVRQDYPDLMGDNFKRLENIKTPKGNQKYPEITEGMPYSGIALAVEEKKWKPPAELNKGFKANIMALMFEERIKLAYSLKKMDRDIKNLPEIQSEKFNKEKVLEYLDYYDIESLKDIIEIFGN